MNDTDPIKVIDREEKVLEPVSMAQADEMIRRGHAEQVHGLVIRKLLSEPDKKLIEKYVLWRDHYTCQDCGNIAVTVRREVRRKDDGSDWADNLIAVCTDCYSKSPDKKDDDIDYPIDGELPEDIYYKNLNRNWQINDRVIDFYRTFYDRHSPIEKVKDKVENIIENNGKLLLIHECDEYYETNDFVLIIQGEEVKKAITFEEYNRIKDVLEEG